MRDIGNVGGLAGIEGVSTYSCVYAQGFFQVGEPGSLQPHFGTAAAQRLAHSVTDWTGGQLSGNPLANQPAVAGLRQAASDLLHSAQVMVTAAWIQICCGNTCNRDFKGLLC